MNKKLLLSFILVFITLSFCFSFGTPEDRGSLQLNHSTVNNENFFWDISQGTDNRVSPEVTFNAIPSDGIGLFRIRANNDISGTAVITVNSDNWNFIHENNYTMQRPYELEAYRITYTRDRQYHDFNASAPQKINLIKIGNEYQFEMQSGTWSSRTSGYCRKFYDYEFRLVLSPTTEVMEPGDYYTSITVDIPSGTNYEGRETVDYLLKGRFGESSTEAFDYSFMVQSTPETYNFDLLNTSCRSVASVSFYATRIVKNPNETVEKNRYKVYLSPFPHLEDDSASVNNPYYFIKYGTENQPRNTLNTVFYEVKKNDAGQNWTKKDNAHPNTYILPISMDNKTISSTWSDKTGKLTWQFEGDKEIGIYIKPTQNSGITPSSGLYYTNLYFFVESN